MVSTSNEKRNWDLSKNRRRRLSTLFHHESPAFSSIYTPETFKRSCRPRLWVTRSGASAR